jgi:drug/metabolite transporter (DMT)-like permease
VRRILVMGATAGLGFALFAYNGFALAPAAHGAVLLPGALPFVTAVLAWAWLGETPTGRRVLSLAVVAAGIILLAGSGFVAAPGAWRGDILFFIATSSYAVFIVLVQRWRVTAIQATAAVALGAAPFYLPVWWLALPSAIGEAAWQEVVFQGVYQGLIAMVLASLLYTRALVALGSTTVSLFTAVVPALAALAAWPVLDEPLGLGALIGVLLVTGGMALGVRRGRVDVPLARP